MCAPKSLLHRLHTLLESAAEYYSRMLLQGSGGGARSHLRERQIGPSLAAEFQLGYSPVERGGLLLYLMNLNHTKEDLVLSGLFSPIVLEKHGNNAVDLMCGRLVIPIRNTKGQVRLTPPSWTTCIYKCLNFTASF